MLDLVEPENGYAALGSTPAYRHTFVYGNVLTSAGAAVAPNMVHWNEDHQAGRGARGRGGERAPLLPQHRARSCRSIPLPRVPHLQHDVGRLRLPAGSAARPSSTSATTSSRRSPRRPVRLHPRSSSPTAVTRTSPSRPTGCHLAGLAVLPGWSLARHVSCLRAITHRDS